MSKFEFINLSLVTWLNFCQPYIVIQENRPYPGEEQIYFLVKYVCTVHQVYQQTYVIPRVGNLTEKGLCDLI
jgi:hypothetical protein